MDLKKKTAEELATLEVAVRDEKQRREIQEANAQADKCLSNLEAIADWGDSRPVYVAQIGQVDTARQLLLGIDAAWLIEQVNEQACEGWGTDDPVIDPSPDAERALVHMLRGMLAAWCEIYDIEGECYVIDSSTVEVIQ